MNEDLRRALDRAAGEDPHVDLAETVWAQGRAVRRRRHAAQAVGGAAAAVAVLGAVLLGGGVGREADVGPAGPTVQDTAVATLPVATPEDPTQATEPVPTTEEPTAVGPPAPEGMLLTATSIGGLPLTAPTAELVAAVSEEFGEPFSAQVDVVGGCSGQEVFSFYNWDGFLLHVQGPDGPEAHRSWETSSTDVVLPHGVRVGMSLEDVLALDTATELPSVASPRYRLGSGIVVSTDQAGVLTTARSERGEVC